MNKSTAGNAEEASELALSDRAHITPFLSKLTSAAIPFLEFRHFKTLRSMIVSPGRSLQENSVCENRTQRVTKTQNAIAYFVIFMAFDLFLTNKILKYPPFNYDNQLLSNLPDVVAPFVLIALMLGIWIIGYFTLGKNRNLGRRSITTNLKEDYYSALEVFIISLYIYGTNFFLAPMILLVFFPFKGAVDDLLESEFKECVEVRYYENMLTDVPLALFMLYMLFRLIKRTEGYKYLYLRYLAFCILSFTYYGSMYGKVNDLSKLLHSARYLN